MQHIWRTFWFAGLYSPIYDLLKSVWHQIPLLSIIPVFSTEDTSRESFSSGTFWVESTTFLCYLFVLALTLSHHYKCTYFQLPDCSFQPWVVCQACFCLRFSLQCTLPQKVFPTNYQVPPLTYQETTNPATEWAFQAHLVEHQPAFKSLLWLMWTPIFNRLLLISAL